MEEIDYIEELRKRKEACVKECNALTKELAALTAFETKKKIAGITLSTDKRLIDLLIERILDPLPDWRTKIDTLIRIPWGDAGRDFLRGGDYFEALFQLAIAIGEMPQFKNVKQFYDIEGYKTKTKKKNYLYTKSVKNSGGGETGIADIMFEVDIGKGNDEDNAISTNGPPKYSCGEIPMEQTANQNPFYFITVKGFIKEHSISQSYDIPLLETQINFFPQITNKHIVVCVRNKEKFLQKLGRTKMDFLKNSVDHVIGYEEVMDVFDAFRTRFFLSLGETPRTITNIMKKVYQMFPNKEDVVVKPSLSMYFHQELIAESVVTRIQEKKDRGRHYLCIGVLPRGGKSFIAGGIINKLRKLKPASTFNVLFLSSAISETIEQFEGDLITKYAEFSDFTFIDARSGTYDKTKNSFVFMSRQLTSKKMKVKGTEVEEFDNEEVEPKTPPVTDLVALLKEKLGNELPKFDICFFDEAHVGINSDMVQDTFNAAFKEFNMPIVMMTATYLNTINVLEDTKDLFVWDTSDIKEMRKLPVFGFDGFLSNTSPPDFIRRNPELVKKLIEIRRTLGESEEQLARPYVNFPDECYISLTFKKDQIAKLIEMNDGFKISDAFKLQDKKTANIPNVLDHTQYKKWWERLTSDARVSAGRIRQYLTPEEETFDGETAILIGKDKQYRALNEIFKRAYESGSRPIPGQPFSILMFLPNDGSAGLIGEVSRVWASFLYQSPYWRNNFVFLTLSVITDPKYKPYKLKNIATDVKERGILHREDYRDTKLGLKELIQTVEYEALKQGKGLVIISGDVGKMGISLKCVDVVCLFTDTSSPDDIIQKAYRAMTDDPPSKKNGFIIDFNIKRTLLAKINYGIAKEKAIKGGKNPNIDEEETVKIIKKTFENSNWGQDAFIEDLAARGETLGEINKKLKDIVLSELLTKTRSVDKKALEDKQFELIQKNTVLLNRVVDVLQFTTGKRPKPKKIELLERGSQIPTTNAAQGEQKEVDEEPQPRAEALPQPLSPEQIKKKIVDIMITFVNALVIKSNEPWTDMKFETLIAKYKADKPKASRVCNCEEKSESTTFPNLYDIVYCELRGYAMLESGKDENGQSKVFYNPEVHSQIMDLMDTLFDESSSLAPDWTIYIESLIKDMSKQKPPARTGGERRHKTKKNKPTVKDKNVRTTKRNHSRDN